MEADHVSYWHPKELSAAASVLCRLSGNGSHELHPPCPKHLATATYALAAVHKMYHSEADGDPFFWSRSDLFTADHPLIDIGNRTWWRLDRRDHGRPEPKVSWVRYQWRRRWGKFRMNDYGRRRSSDSHSGELVSSLCTDGHHMPALDLDFQVTLVPSTTEGHYHLYLNRRLTWRRYRRFLRACKRAGVIEPGYYRAAVRRKATYLWRPGFYKRNEEASR